MVTPSACRAARGLLDLGAPALAKAIGVSRNTLHNYDAGRGSPLLSTVKAIQREREVRAVEFLDNGGVQLKERSA